MEIGLRAGVSQSPVGNLAVLALDDGGDGRIQGLVSREEAGQIDLQG